MAITEPEEISQPTATSSRFRDALFNNLASVAPTVTDDSRQGYAPNSFWFKAVPPYRLWHCSDASEGAADWNEIPLVRGSGIADFIDTYTSTDTEADIFSATVPANTWDANGVEVEAKYHASYSGADLKYLFLYLGGTSIFSQSADIDQSSGGATLSVSIMRTDFETAKCAVSMNSLNDPQKPIYTEVTGLDFTADIELLLTGSSDTAGQMLVQFGKVVKVRESGERGYSSLTFDGSFLTFDGEEVVF